MLRLALVLAVDLITYVYCLLFAGTCGPHRFALLGLAQGLLPPTVGTHDASYIYKATHAEYNLIT